MTLSLVIGEIHVTVKNVRNKRLCGKGCIGGCNPFQIEATKVKDIFPVLLLTA